MPLNSLFEITRFASFLEALVENPEYRKSLQRPLEIVIEADKTTLAVKEWIDFWEGSPISLEHSPLSAPSWKLLDSFNSEEMQVVHRWILDKLIREYGSSQKKRGLKQALDLLSIVLHELCRETPPEVLIPLVEQYQPLVQEPSMASDLYQWLFSCSFNPEAPSLDAYLLALHGLEKARLSGDADRIGWSAYNLITYQSFGNAEEAEALLEEHLEYIQEERYYDAVGNIAMRYLDDKRNDRARGYLQAVWHYTQRLAAADELTDLRTIAFNLAYYAINLAWIHYDEKDLNRAEAILKKILQLMHKEKDGFLEAAADLGNQPIDWALQYHVHMAETYLWLYTCYEEMHQEAQAHAVMNEFQQYRLNCSYDLEPIVKDFFQEREED